MKIPLNMYSSFSRYILTKLLITYLCLVIRPRSEFHFARLFVEWEVSDIDFTRGFESSRWGPEDSTVVGDHGVDVHVAGGEVISTVT